MSQNTLQHPATSQISHLSPSLLHIQPEISPLTPQTSVRMIDANAKEQSFATNPSDHISDNW